MAAAHKITALRSGSHPTMGDWEAEYEITFRFIKGRPAKMYLRNGDPGYPADPDEIEFVSITPDAGDHGVFTELAQQGLEDWARDWLETDGFDEAIQIATSDLDAARDQADEMRRESREPGL